MAVVDLFILADAELLFEQDAGWTRDVGAAKREFQRKYSPEQDEQSWLQVTV